MGCGCGGSKSDPRQQPRVRDQRAVTTPPPPRENSQGAMGSKNYYSGPARAPKPEG